MKHLTSFLVLQLSLLFAFQAHAGLFDFGDSCQTSASRYAVCNGKSLSQSTKRALAIGVSKGLRKINREFEGIDVVVREPGPNEVLVNCSNYKGDGKALCVLDRDDLNAEPDLVYSIVDELAAQPNLQCWFSIENAVDKALRTNLVPRYSSSGDRRPLTKVELTNAIISVGNNFCARR